MQIAHPTTFAHPTQVHSSSAQYELAIDAAPTPTASRHEATGLALGRDYALYGITPPIEHLYAQSPLQRGWMAQRARRLPLLDAHAYTAQWLALRTHAWARGRAFEDVQLTPNYLQQIDTDYCPITRDPLEAGSRSIDRVRDDAGYAAGNLVVMSALANAAKGSRDHAELMAMARSCELGPITHIGGLGAAEWERLAVLASYVTELPHEVAATLPMVVLPPNRLRLFNPIQALQALITRQLTRPGWSARLARLEALLPSDGLRSDFNRLVLALAPRVLEAVKLSTPEQIRWALEDAWRQSLVQKRWQRWALQLSAEQAEQLVARAAAKGLATTHVQCHSKQLATEGWALADHGYQAEMAA
jgi:hypothetical protein